MGVAPEPRQAQFLTFEILGTFDFGLCQNTVSQGVLRAGYENQISDALSKGPCDRFPSGDRNFAVAAKHRCRHHGRRGNKTSWNSRSYFLNRPTSSAIHGIDWDIVRAE